MFECPSLIASVDWSFVYYDADDDPALLPEKRATLSRFLSIDPEGAGGAARDYCTAWGVA